MRVSEALDASFDVRWLRAGRVAALPELVQMKGAAALMAAPLRRQAEGCSVIVSSLLANDVIAARIRRPWILSYQSDWLWHLSQVPAFRRRLYLSSLRSTLSRADLVIAPSRGAAAQVGRLVRNPPRVHVVPNAVDPKMFDDHMDAPAAPPYQVVCIGRLVHQKDPLLAVEVLAELRHHGDFNLRFVGDGPLRQDVLRLAETRGLMNSISITGWLSAGDIREQPAHVLLSTSFTETFGNVMAEAVVAGCPVVAVATDGAEALHELSPAGLDVVERSPRVLARAILRAVLKPRAAPDPAAVMPLHPSCVAQEWAALIRTLL